MDTVNLNLTNTQMRKAKANKVFQMTFKALDNSPNISIQLTDSKEIKRFHRAMKNNKGFRFKNYRIIQFGDGIGKQLKSLANKSINLLKTEGQRQLKLGLSRGVDTLQSQLNSANNQVSNLINGSGIAKELKKLGNKSINLLKTEGRRQLNLGLSRGTNMLQSQLNSATNQADDLINNGGNGIKKELKKLVNKSFKLVKDEGRNKLNNALNNTTDVLQSQLNSANNQASNLINGGSVKFKKGSQEAKDHMARIRAMRKGGSGIKKELKKIVYKTGDLLKNKAKNVLSKVANNAIDYGVNSLESVANYVGGPVTSVALDSQFDRLRNVTKNNIYNQINKIGSGIGKRKDYDNNTLNPYLQHENDLWKRVAVADKKPKYKKVISSSGFQPF